ncbi:MAG: hypothetical protein QG608_1911 [Actinomycetota bacterium]|nr:hypothetical protein [Actinomycetota bacterium]
MILDQGHSQAVGVSPARHEELLTLLGQDAPVPGWLSAAARAAWDACPPVGTALRAVLRTRAAGVGFERASWELDLACNFRCAHCYLEQRPGGGLDWSARKRLLGELERAGTLWLQLTGGEPLADPLFAST